MKRKLTALFCVLCIMLGILPSLSVSAAADEEEEASPAQEISSAADLAALAQTVNSGDSCEDERFVLTKDIDLSGRSWVPIGSGETAKACFSGSFDGGGYTISGLSISGSYVCAGLFGRLQGGEVKNLTLSDCRITASAANVGAFAGLSTGSVQNCMSSGSVSVSYSGGTANVGGIVGFSVSGGEVAVCTNEAAVSASGNSENNVGGIAGCNKGKMERCSNLGAVTASGSGVNNAGGLSGFENDGTTQNCYNRAQVSATGGREGNAGGLAGSMSTNHGKLQNSYNTGKIVAAGGSASLGGAVGKRLVGTVYYCYYKKSGSLTGIGGKSDYQGFVTGLTAAQMTASQGDKYALWSAVNVGGSELGGVSLADALNKGTGEQTDMWGLEAGENDGYPIIKDNYWTDSNDNRCLFADLSWKQVGLGSSKNPYVISTAEQLAGLAALVNAQSGQTLSGAALDGSNGASATAGSFEGKHIVLGADIDLAKRLWVPIGDEEHPFKGSFDGAGYEIHNMYVGTERVNSRLKYNGLFGCTAGAIENVSIEKDSAIFITGETTEGICAGGVAGLNSGSISGCESYCSIVVADCGMLYMGGIAGSNRGREALLERCYSNASLKAEITRITALSPACIGGITGISIRPEKSERSSVSEEDAVKRNAVLSCRNEGKLDVTVRGKAAKAMVGGVAGANVLIGSLVPDVLTGGSDANADASASLQNCCNAGSIKLVLRATGAMAAIGGVAGGNVFCSTEVLLANIFTGSGDIGFGGSGRTAKTENCYSSGSISATFTRGEKLLTGGVLGLLSDSKAKTANCFYKAGSLKPAATGIGSNTADKSGETDAINMQMTELSRKLSDWAKQNELAAWHTGGTEYPYHNIRVSYSANGGENPPKDDHIYLKDESTNIDFSVIPTRTDYVFAGWAKSASATEPDFTQDGGIKNTVKLAENLSLYAVWKDNKPQSKDTYTDTKKNDDGTTTSSATTKTVAKDGSVKTEITENTTDAAGKTVKTRTVSSVFDSAAGTTTERIKEKSADGKTVNTAAFSMKDADKVSALPSELSKELRAGSLENVTLKDEKNGTSTALGWSTDADGKKLSQSATLSCDRAEGSVKLSAALIKELTEGAYEKLNIEAADGLGISLAAAALKSLEGKVPELSMKREGNTVSLSSGGAAIEAAASAEYEQQGENKVVVVDCVGTDGEKTRVLAKFEDGKVSFTVPAGAEKFEISEIDFPFTDVKTGDWFNTVVHQMFGSGLMTGVSDASFAPNGTASRAMLVTMLWRMENEPEGGNAGAFADVFADAWYSKAVGWAAAKEIVSGVSAASFAPDAPVTREQLVTILYRWRGYEGDVDELPELSDFADGGSASAFAADALRWAVKEGYLTGKSGGMLDPQGAATRSELAAILSRVLGL